MRRYFQISLAAALLAGIPASAQFLMPEIAFDSAADPLRLPDNIHLGEVAGVAIDSAGSLYIADSGNNRIRKVSNGVITTVAGNRTGAFSGDNGPATGADIDNPSGVAVDSAGNLYIADYSNRHFIRIHRCLY
jgi:glucose/arabinose dehydrogenase